MFSWLTADTQQSIPNMYSGHRNAGKKVYLLLPNGERIEESEYSGYGDFGSRDAYEVLAEQNFSHMDEYNTLSHEQKRIIGITVDVGSLYLKDGVVYVRSSLEFAIPFLMSILSDDIEINLMPESFDWDDYESKSFQSFNLNNYKPLKFSFDANAKYDELPASKNCPYQGHFY